MMSVKIQGNIRASLCAVGVAGMRTAHAELNSLVNAWCTTIPRQVLSSQKKFLCIYA